MVLNTSRDITYIVNSDEAGQTLRQFLRKQGYSQKLLAQFKHQGGLQVNGAFSRLIDPLTAGDCITVTCPVEHPSLKPNPNLNIPIVYQDDDIILFNKPADMLTHPCARQFDDALGNYFVALFPQLTFRPIGRLDRNTTGLCFVAKHRLAAANAKESLYKTYYAILEGVLPDDSGTIDLPLVRVPGPTIKRAVDINGQKAITHYQVLLKTDWHTLVAVRLETGRTHQIRAHFAAIQHPLAGDTLYGGSNRFLSRQALHCGHMSFAHPVTKKTMTCHAPLPQDMAALLPANFSLTGF